MGSFYLILFSRGPKWTATHSPEVEEIQRGHNKHLNHLHNHYRAVSGPYEGAPHNLSGMTMMPTTDLSEDEVRRLFEDDPAVQAGRLIVDIVKWHTPPGFVVLG